MWLRNSEMRHIAEMLAVRTDMVEKYGQKSKLGVLLIVLKIKVISLCLVLEAMQSHWGIV